MSRRHASNGAVGLGRRSNQSAGAKQFLRAAKRRRMIEENPFGDMKGISVQRNKERFYFVTRDEAHKVLMACPDAQWKLIFALCRFGGLRCPSELMELRWHDIDWEANKITVHSPKTAHHGEEHAYRVIPLFPKLRPYLEAVRDLVNPGIDTPLSDPVITRYQGAGTNLRSQLKRFIKNAKLQPGLSYSRIFAARGKPNSLSHFRRMSYVTGWATVKRLRTNITYR